MKNARINHTVARQGMNASHLVRGAYDAHLVSATTPSPTAIIESTSALPARDSAKVIATALPPCVLPRLLTLGSALFCVEPPDVLQ